MCGGCSGEKEPQRFLAVLIVEDNADEAAVLKTAFGAHGYRVDTALTGEQAETKFGAQAYDIVILDHHLPDTRGDRLLAAFKQQRPEAVYLAITGDPNPELALGWMKQGVAAFVSKPFAPQYLIELCVRAIREQDLLRVEDRLEIRTQELRRNEERHRSILRAALDGFWRADLEGRLLEVNEAYCRMSGYSEQELLAMNIADVEAAEGQANVAAHTHKIVTQGRDRFESRHRRKDGSCYPVEVSAQYKPADDGYTVAFIRDISARKQAEAALRASEERYRGIFDESVTAIYVFDKDKHFLDSNQAGLDLLGYSREELLRLSMPDVDADPQVVLPAHAELLSGGRLINYEHKLRRKDGSIVTVLNNSRSLTNPRGGVIGMQSTLVDITEHKRAEAALDHERYLLRTLVDLVPDFIFIKDTQSRFLMVNAALAKCYRQAPSAMLGRTDAELLPAEIAARCRASEGRVLLTDTCQAFEDTISFADGVPRTVVTHMVAFRDVHGQVGGLVGIGRDITDRKRSEEEREKLRAQLAHAQKMESVGRLAGGVAHDFNNMLQAILGNVSLALGCVPPESPLRESLEEIQSCAQRSAELTRQLLAFARKQTVTPKVLDLNETIEGMLKLLRRLIGEHISLAWLPGKNLGLVRLDPSQVDQVLANLCVNARDALEDGGRVTIETDNIAFDESYTAHHPEALAGDYVRIVVSDNGCGMEPEVLAHVFEPFFTTKEVGHGTGLGLATVYGIITQNGGFIVADSKPGQGTCFEIHLPRYAGKAAQLEPGGSRSSDREGTGNDPAGGGRAGHIARRQALPGKPGLHGARGRDPWRSNPPCRNACRQDSFGDHRCGDARDERSRAGHATAFGLSEPEALIHVRVHCRHRRPSSAYWRRTFLSSKSHSVFPRWPRKSVRRSHNPANALSTELIGLTEQRWQHFWPCQPSSPISTRTFAATSSTSSGGALPRNSARRVRQSNDWI